MSAHPGKMPRRRAESRCVLITHLSARRLCHPISRAGGRAAIYDVLKNAGTVFPATPAAGSEQHSRCTWRSLQGYTIDDSHRRYRGEVRTSSGITQRLMDAFFVVQQPGLLILIGHGRPDPLDSSLKRSDVCGRQNQFEALYVHS